MTSAFLSLEEMGVMLHKLLLTQTTQALQKINKSFYPVEGFSHVYLLSYVLPLTQKLLHDPFVFRTLRANFDFSGYLPERNLHKEQDVHPWHYLSAGSVVSLAMLFIAPSGGRVLHHKTWGTTASILNKNQAACGNAERGCTKHLIPSSAVRRESGIRISDASSPMWSREMGTSSTWGSEDGQRKH